MSESTERDQRFALLMRAAQAGDREAYARLLHELIPLLRRAVRRQRALLKPQDAEDLVQDILLSLHEARRSYDPTRPFLPWLMAIVRNRVADGARRYISRSAHEVVVDRLPETFSDADPNTIDGRYGDPEALRAAIARLLGDPDEAERMGKAGRALVESRHTLDGWVAGIADVVTAARPRARRPGRPCGSC